MHSYLVSAALVLPDARQPLVDGAVLVRGRRIAAVGRRADLAARSLPHLRLGAALLVPGLINAHTHLALSDLEDLRPRRRGFTPWLRGLRRHALRRGPAELRRGLDRGIRRSLAAGTTAVGDIVPLALLERARRSPLGGMLFVELLGFDAPFPPEPLPALREGEGLAPHAPYSTSAAIYRGAAALAAREERLLALHVAESEDETRFLRDGGGPLRRFREERAPLGAWKPPGTSPLAYLETLGALAVPALAVHATFATTAEHRLLLRHQVAVVTCPRSNLALTGQTADVPALLAAGVPVAIGTDSLASAPSLSLLDELRALRQAHPSLSAATAFDLATRGGSQALRQEGGELRAGLPADLAAFPLPSGDGNPYEALLAAGDACFVAVRGRILVGEAPA